MNKLKTAIASICLLASAGANADIIGGTLEASIWHAGISGDANDGPAKIDVEEQLNFDGEIFFEIAASFEHPVPLIPNVKVKHTSLTQDASGLLNTNFDGVNGNVNSDLDLTHFDGIFYYEILDNWVTADIGLNVKKFDGHLNLKTVGTTTQSNTEIDEFLPLGYAKAEVELPFTGWAVGAELSGISYSDNAFYDAKASIKKNISLVFVELGYRQIAIRLEDLGGNKDIDIDADYSGLYLSAGLDF